MAKWLISKSRDTSYEGIKSSQTKCPVEGGSVNKIIHRVNLPSFRKKRASPKVILRLNFDHHYTKAHRELATTMRSSAPACPYAMMKYPQKFRLEQKRTISDQEQANNASVSVEQTNIEGKFVQNAWPNVPHLVTSV